MKQRSPHKTDCCELLWLFSRREVLRVWNSPPTSPLWFHSSLLFPVTHFWSRALLLSALCTAEWSRCQGDESMTSFNPSLYLFYEGEFIGLEPKVILHFWGIIEKIFPFLLHPLSRKNNFGLTRIFNIYHKCPCIPYWSSAQDMKCSSAVYKCYQAWIIKVIWFLNTSTKATAVFTRCTISHPAAPKRVNQSWTAALN